NNHRRGEEHWQNPQWIRQYILDSGQIRPMNSVKIYGADTGRYGTHRDAQERFWRLIFGGVSSARFHRPDSGLGLSAIAQAHIRSLRDLTDRIDIFTCAPHNDLLSQRSSNEAYCTANPGVEYAVFFPAGGNVLLDVAAAAGRKLTVHWLDIRQSEWGKGTTIASDGSLQLVAPADTGYWAAVIKVAASELDRPRGD
ncbi:MAG: putative collagen-binding domain-containing protein, partial [Candidatus Latescibacteria bacterium]|nr:putative collagen-binding domain-containing protein [Candidatus Latescibacterota bacterium]